MLPLATAAVNVGLCQSQNEEGKGGKGDKATLEKVERPARAAEHLNHSARAALSSGASLWMHLFDLE